jgi:hypothetical protein
MTRTNRYPGKCARCSAAVAADQGTLQGPPWKTICQGCLPFPSASSSAPRVRVSLSGDRAAVEPRDRLNGAWGAYRSACEGLTKSRKVNDQWETTSTIEDAAELIERLRAVSAITVEVDPAPSPSSIPTVRSSRTVSASTSPTAGSDTCWRRGSVADSSNPEWALAIGVCRKYHRQVGECPEVAS